MLGNTAIAQVALAQFPQVQSRITPVSRRAVGPNIFSAPVDATILPLRPPLAPETAVRVNDPCVLFIPFEQTTSPGDTLKFTRPDGSIYTVDNSFWTVLAPSASHILYAAAPSEFGQFGWWLVQYVSATESAPFAFYIWPGHT